MKPQHQWESIVDKAQQEDWVRLDPELWEPILYAHQLIEDQSNELGRRYARIAYLEARLKKIEHNQCEAWV